MEEQMKFIFDRKNQEPKIPSGRVRVVTRFLWLPRIIGNHVCWLTNASCKERWDRCDDFESGKVIHGRWVAEEWWDDDRPLPAHYHRA